MQTGWHEQPAPPGAPRPALPIRLAGAPFGAPDNAPAHESRSRPRVRPHPMMAQYLGLKADFPDTCCCTGWAISTRSFTTTPARVTAALLDLTLTQRGQSAGEPVVMAGVPVHALESYLAKLIKLGEAVAIAEQVGEVGASKGPVERKVVRVVTPGTITDTELLADKTGRRAAGRGTSGRRFGLAGCPSPGRNRPVGMQRHRVARLARSPAPAEIPGGPRAGAAAMALAGRWPVTNRPGWQFDAQLGNRKLCEQLRARACLGQCAGPAARHMPPPLPAGFCRNTQGRALAHMQRARACSAPAT